jgi:hypothetical protein
VVRESIRATGDANGDDNRRVFLCQPGDGSNDKDKDFRDEIEEIYPYLSGWEGKNET